MWSDCPSGTAGEPHCNCNTCSWLFELQVRSISVPQFHHSSSTGLIILAQICNDLCAWSPVASLELTKWNTQFDKRYQQRWCFCGWWFPWPGWGSLCGFCLASQPSQTTSNVLCRAEATAVAQLAIWLGQRICLTGAGAASIEASSAFRARNYEAFHFQHGMQCVGLQWLQFLLWSTSTHGLCRWSQCAGTWSRWTDHCRTGGHFDFSFRSFDAGSEPQVHHLVLSDLRHLSRRVASSGSNDHDHSHSGQHLLGESSHPWCGHLRCSCHIFGAMPQSVQVKWGLCQLSLYLWLVPALWCAARWAGSDCECQSHQLHGGIVHASHTW